MVRLSALEILSTAEDEPNTEILNEPFLAARTGVGAALAFLTYSAFDSTEQDFLQPLYDAVHASIRQHDREALILFEPVTGNAGGNAFTVGGSLLGDDEVGAKKSIFAYHIYGRNAVNKHMGNTRGQIETRMRQAARLGVGSIVRRARSAG